MKGLRNRKRIAVSKFLVIFAAENLILMKKLMWQNRWFLIPFSVFILVCIMLLLVFTKPELHILLNKANSLTHLNTPPG